MMRYLLISSFVFLFCFNNSLLAQDPICVPDGTVPDTVAGVYPLGTITDTVCINHDFYYDFTVVVTDSINIPSLGVALSIDSIQLATSGAISNLPAGLTYGCNPNNCTIAANSKGCLRIYGMVTDQAEIGDHDLKLSANVFVTGFPTPINYVLPTSDFPPFILTVREETFGNCFGASSVNQLAQYLSIQVNPNPSDGLAFLDIISTTNDWYELSIYDLTGKVVKRESVNLVEGKTHYPLNMEAFDSGIYFYAIKNNLGKSTGKFSIMK